jgi:hypothetical protein
MAGNKNSGNRNTPKNKTPLDKEKEILSHLKKGKGLIETAALTKTSRNTVSRIRYENADNLPQWRKNTLENLTRVHDKLLHNIEENIDKIPAAAKTISLGIINDKIKDMAGDGNQIVEHRHVHINHGDLNSLLTDKSTAGKSQNIKENDNTQKERHTPTSPADIIDITPQKESQHESQTGGGGSR